MRQRTARVQRDHASSAAVTPAVDTSPTSAANAAMPTESEPHALISEAAYYRARSGDSRPASRLRTGAQAKPKSGEGFRRNAGSGAGNVAEKGGAQHDAL